MFERFFSTKAFYFSSEYDLTNAFSISAGKAFKNADLDDRFYYNSAFTGRFKEYGLDNWVQPFICGLVVQRLLTVNQKSMSFTLISRRDKSRAGMRFISRGSDAMGHVSNYAETEQLVSFINEDNYDVYSYLQTRGSIPVIWKQTPNLKWSPGLKIESNLLRNKSAFENHMNRMKKHYGENFIINLIDKKGSQKKIGDIFTDMVKSTNDPVVKYTWFDFHAETKKMQWHNLSKLVNELLPDIQRYKYGQYRIFKTVEFQLTRSMNMRKQE